ncbi:MAG: GNAT family N-acetyltransferase [Bacteroidota bacterium]
MNLTIRKANLDDVPTIAFLAHKIWNEHYISIISRAQINFMLDKMYSEESLTEQMNQGHQFFLVNQKDIDLGYCSISKKEEGKYFVNKFYVDVSSHRSGIGTQLFNYVLQQIPDYKTIELAVNRENYKAINFYFKLGFTIKHTFDLEIGGGFYMNDFLMVRCK